MNRLQLATLLSWAGDAGFQGRKRLQKVVYFLQEAGCPLNCRFTLHHFGPYSREVADACDELVAAGLVSEIGGPSSGNLQYNYALKLETRLALERTPDLEMQRFRELGTHLIEENLWSLELGATILYFHSQERDWSRALTQACEFKKVSASAEASEKSLALAKQVSGWKQ